MKSRTETLARAMAGAIWFAIANMDDALHPHAGRPESRHTPVGEHVKIVVAVSHDAGGRGTAEIVAYAGYVTVRYVDLPAAVVAAARGAASELGTLLDLRPQGGDDVWRDCGVCPDIAAAVTASVLCCETAGQH